MEESGVTNREEQGEGGKSGCIYFRSFHQTIDDCVFPLCRVLDSPPEKEKRLTPLRKS
jgi:hypothetical protein